MERVWRYATSADLTEATAERLMRRLIELQAAQEGPVRLCLTGGRIANRIYEAFIDLVDDAPLDQSRMEIWWGDERFVPTEDPDRHAGYTLAILARKLPMIPSLTHPMLAADGIADNDASAAAYAKELGDTRFDITLLGMGVDGHVASIFPNHPSFGDQAHPVIGVNDAPLGPPSRISMTVDTLNRSHEVWYLVAGEGKATAVAESVAGDPNIPAGVVRGTDATLWLLDRSAAGLLPYHSCSF